MNQLKQLLSSLLIVMIATISTQANSKVSQSWIDAAIDAKLALRGGLHEAGLPVISPVAKAFSPSVKLVANVKGQQHLVLVADSTPDGTNGDWSTFLNSKLIKADGTEVWLDELTPISAKTGAKRLFINETMYGDPVVVGGKTYKHALFCHANAVLIYDIGGEYVRFETEAGVVDKHKPGTVQFSVINIYPTKEANELMAKFTSEFGALASDAGSLEAWLTTQGEVAERRIISDIISKLNEKSYFEKQLSQLGGNGDKERLRNALELYDLVRSVYEIQKDLEWLNVNSIGLALNDMKRQKGYDGAKYDAMYAELQNLVSKGFSDIYKGDSTAIASAKRALELKKAILTSNKLLDGDKIVAARYNYGSMARKLMAPQLGTQANNWSTQLSASRTGFDADIVEITNLRGTPKVRSIYAPNNSSPISDLKLHWDADRVMFTQVGADGKWNVHEVKLDGSGFKPLIKNPESDLEFFDGTYLPDGRIHAMSNIGYNGVPCVNGADIVGNLMIYNPKDESLRRITFDQDANLNPSVTNDGKVMYTRWEYTDLTHYYTRIVMTMNPDGTEQKALYGSGSMFPNSTFDMKPIPGSASKFIGIISGHHGIARSGRLILFDPAKSRKGRAGMVQELPFKDREIIELVKDELVDGVWPQFVKPSVLNDKYFLVAAKLGPQELWGIYLIDVFDNITCLMKLEGEGYISPFIVEKQTTPPVIPDKVKVTEKEATFFIQDIYEGEGLKGIPRGTVKKLRLHAYEYAYIRTVSDHNWHGIQSGWDIKRILGEVPVEEDGSVIFKAPANTPISIQPIDGNGVAVQWMRSWVVGQPGEVVSCVGCHEDLNKIAKPTRTIASRKTPEPLTKPEGGVRSFTFELEIQPILDRNCVSCHNSKGRTFDLSAGQEGHNGFSGAYLNFHPYFHRQGGEGDMLVLFPYEYHANTSEMIRMLKKGHHGVELTDEEWRKLYNWIDYNCPYKGYFNHDPLEGLPFTEHGKDQYSRRIELQNKYACGAGVDWKKEIADYAEHLKSKGEVTPATPKPVKEVKEKVLKAKGWPFSAEQAKAMTNSERKSVEIAPGVVVNFVRIPAGEFVMGSYSGEPDAYPTTKVKIDKAFWMAELETTNEQFNVIFPDHFSRHMDQQWKDHVVPGYVAHEPGQPVIRVTYNQVMEYCQKLSEKTGLKITIPTEAQWEWACRAGSDTDFWYGGLNSDFGKKENMADETTNEFAVSGVDPKPMTKDMGIKYELYTYLPKEASVNDGSLIQIAGKKYEANPFGLYNMHGNVAEWTKSDYLPYPYRESSKVEAEEKVVRGGSFIDRPKYSTSHTRKAYYRYQPVFNVGFRMIIED